MTYFKKNWQFQCLKQWKWLDNLFENIQIKPRLFQVLSWWARVTGSLPGSLFRVSTVLATWPCPWSLTSSTTGGTSKWPSLCLSSCLLHIYGNYYMYNKSLFLEQTDFGEVNLSLLTIYLAFPSVFSSIFLSFFLLSVEHSTQHSNTKPMFWVITKNWQNLNFVYTSILPESIRWLLSKGREEEAKEIIKKVAETNKVSITEDMLEGLRSPSEKQKEAADDRKYTFVDLFRPFRMLMLSLNVWFNW